jgi:hypothetical protein
MVALLKRAGALDLVPTPIDQVMQVAKLVSATEVTLAAEEKLGRSLSFRELISEETS